MLTAPCWLFANPLPVFYLNEVQILPVSRVEVNFSWARVNHWEIITSAGTMQIQTITNPSKYYVLNDTNIIGDFTLNSIADSIVLVDTFGYKVDKVKWPGDFEPPIAGASAAWFCSTSYYIDPITYEEWTQYYYYWNTNWPPSFGAANPTSPNAVVEQNTVTLASSGLNIKAFPNPARAQTVLSYAVPPGEDYNLKLYDLSGRLVKNLDQGKGKGGYINIQWHGDNEDQKAVSAGNYLAVLSSGGQKTTQKITWLK
jgi:hypothetical protein